MQQILKENIVYIILMAAALIGGIIVTAPKLEPAVKATMEKYSLDSTYTKTKQELDTLTYQSTQKVEKISEGGKRIYEVQGMQFSADASFAPLFESIINIAKTSGIRIRSIDYNYEPQDDIIFSAKLPGYNVCELTIVAIGSYTQFQNFYKSILKEEYLNYLAELEVRPFKENRSILVTTMKLRLYTKTPGAASTAPSQPETVPPETGSAPVGVQ